MRGLTERKKSQKFFENKSEILKAPGGMPVKVVAGSTSTVFFGGMGVAA